MDWTTVLIRDERVVARAVAGETLLVPIEGELANLQRIFALEGVGETIWDLLDGERDLGAVRDAVVERFDVDADEAGRDCLAFATELALAKLVHVR